MFDLKSGNEREVICTGCDGAGLVHNASYYMSSTMCKHCNGHGVVVMVKQRKELPEMLVKYSVDDRENETARL
jgi:DnaJ-class molecular chaperone